MSVDFWCSREPYIAHAAPVWHALDPEQRGWFAVPPRLMPLARDLGIAPVTQAAAKRLSDRAKTKGPLVILSRCELPRVPKMRRLAFMEHGVGPNYEGRPHLPYDRRIALVLTTAAQEPVHRPLYGDAVHVIGCPKLDAYHGRRWRRHKTPVVAVSHHWDQRTYPETRSAWPWDAPGWERVIASGRYRVLAHKHPGDPREIEPWFAERGVEFVPRFSDIMERADVYVCDNSSTMYEFASTGRPVVCLNPPWYRRKVDFGVRFWSHLPGPCCDSPRALPRVIEQVLDESQHARAARVATARAVYGHLDGRAAERAAALLTALPAEQHYPLAVTVRHDGVLYKRGTRLPRSLLLEMKAAGVIKGRGL